MLAEEIQGLDCEVTFTPSEEMHEYHADIKFGYILEKSEPPPTEIKFKMEEMARISRVNKDSKPEDDEWIDGKVK